MVDEQLSPNNSVYLFTYINDIRILRTLYVTQHINIYLNCGLSNPTAPGYIAGQKPNGSDSHASVTFATYLHFQ